MTRYTLDPPCDTWLATWTFNGITRTMVARKSGRWFVQRWPAKARP